MTTGREEEDEERTRTRTDQRVWHGKHSHILGKIWIFNMVYSFSNVMSLVCRPYLRNDFIEIQGEKHSLVNSKATEQGGGERDSCEIRSRRSMGEDTWTETTTNS
ncbi:MAG: hypothetical protein GY696_25800 [Gammaproteobacteria bacterium]|nr:hypothetical protein [Gammaproteobacteria bacterium]